MVLPTNSTATGPDALIAALDALPEGLALFDAERRLLVSNMRFRDAHSEVATILRPGLAWAEFLRHASDRASGEGLARVGAAFEAEPTRSAAVEAFEAEPTRSAAVEAARSGDRRVRVAIHPDATGGFALIETDVTEARIAEDLRAEAEDMLRQMLDACAPSIALCRLADGGLVYRTPAWAAMFGPVTHEGAIHSHPGGRADLLAALLPTGRIDGVEISLRDAAGRVFPAQVSAQVIDYAGEDAVVSSYADLTLLKAQEEQIRSVNQRLFDAIAALDQGFALFDAAGAMVLANARYRAVNAVLADVAVPGAKNAAIVSAAVMRGAEPLAAGWPGAGREPIGARYDFTLIDGRIFAASRRQTSDGGFVLAWRDVTEARTAARELARRQEQTQEAEKIAALAALLADVAHELNNPLLVVTGQALMLRDEALTPEALRRVEKIATSAERCARIVRAFVAMARQRPPVLAPVAVSEALETALDVAADTLAETGATASLRLPAELPLIMADAEQVIRVVVDLLTHTAQTAAASGCAVAFAIDALIEDDGAHVVLRLADDSPGVTLGQRAGLLDPLRAVKAAASGGSLALCRQIVIAHGGTIEMSDRPGGGGLCVLTLPTARTVDGAAP